MDGKIFEGILKKHLLFFLICLAFLNGMFFSIVHGSDENFYIKISKTKKKLNGSDYLEQGSFYQALVHLNAKIQERALKLRIEDLHPEIPEKLFYYLGMTLFTQKRFDEALREFRKSSERCSNYSKNFDILRLSRLMEEVCLYRLSMSGNKNRYTFSKEKLFWLRASFDGPLDSRGTMQSFKLNPVESLALDVILSKYRKLILESLCIIPWGEHESIDETKEGAQIYYYNTLNLYYLARIFLQKSLILLMEEVNSQQGVERDKAFLNLCKALTAVGNHKEALAKIDSLMANPIEILPSDMDDDDPPVDAIILILRERCLSDIKKSQDSIVFKEKKYIGKSLPVPKNIYDEIIQRVVIFWIKKLGHKRAFNMVHKTEPKGFVKPHSRGMGNFYDFKYQSYLRSLGRLFLYDVSSKKDFCTAAMYLERSFLKSFSSPGSLSDMKQAKSYHDPIFLVDLMWALYGCGDLQSITERLFSGSAIQYYFPECNQTAQGIGLCVYLSRK